MLYVLHGENALLREEALGQALAATGLPPDLMDLNVERLTGTVPAAELRRACSTVPFLGDARVVIARNMLRPAQGDAAREIADYLPHLPPTTHLIFVDQKALPKSNIVLKRAIKLQAKIARFDLPKDRDLPGWIQGRVHKRGGRIAPPAAALLARNIGPKLGILDQEIQKLLLYCGEEEIGLEAVKVMVPYIQSADVIFDLVDAVGQRNARNAANYLHRLLDVGNHPLPIFGMILRQFRMLAQVRWLVDRRYNQQEITERLKLHPYVARKVRGQVNRFTPAQLRAAYALLLEADLAIKTGRLTPETALDLLVAQLTSL